MSPEAQNRAIAEWLGVKYHKPTEEEIKRGSYYQYEPDYTRDLNLIHVAERRLSLNEWTPYLDNLDKICVPVHICPTTHAMAVYCADASQRAEALLKAIGKWVE